MRKDTSEFYESPQRRLCQSRSTKTSAQKNSREINWGGWNPFERATGDALQQLNHRQKKHVEIEGEEALL
jgi:hypothetical protein